MSHFVTAALGNEDTQVPQKRASEAEALYASSVLGSTIPVSRNEGAGVNQRREDGQWEDVVSSRLLLVTESLKKVQCLNTVY